MFFQYKLGATEKNVGPLEEWPFTNPASNYVIKEGSTPTASGRIDQSGPTSRMGVWRCTKGTFECTEQGDELMTVLSGKCQIINHSENEVVYNLQAGDTLFIKGGSRVTWKISEDVIKVFYGQKEDGY